MATIKLKTGTGAPAVGDLVQGEIGIDLSNSKVYSKNSSNAIFEIGKAGDTGKRWVAGISYSAGDIVEDSGDVYVANVDVTNKTDSPSTPNSEFTLINVPEKGGIGFSTTVDYAVGDVVVYNSKAYFCSTAHSHGAWDSNNFTEIGKVEVGGRVYDNGVGYIVGDVISYNDKIYLCKTNTTAGEDPVGTPAKWITYESVEFGGRLWDTNLTYAQGDIVTDSTDGLIYSALRTTTGDVPNSSSSDWKLVGAGKEIGGVRWVADTSYAVYDIVGHNNNVYLCKTANNDNAFDANNWILINEVELGGIVWVTGTSYKAGTVVTEGNKLYIAKSNTTSQPSATPADWLEIVSNVAERGGIAWKTAIDYKVGDVIVESSNAYLCTADHTSGTFASDSANWKLINVSERAGIEYNSANDSKYVLGDVVTHNEIAYIVTTVPTTGDPVAKPAEYERIGIPERGGLAYNSSTTYKKGDLVTYSSVIYECTKTTSTGDTPQVMIGETPNHLFTLLQHLYTIQVVLLNIQIQLVMVKLMVFST
jgi:hypothetical protein